MLAFLNPFSISDVGQISPSPTNIHTHTHLNTHTYTHIYIHTYLCIFEKKNITSQYNNYSVCNISSPFVSFYFVSIKTVTGKYLWRHIGDFPEKQGNKIICKYQKISAKTKLLWTSVYEVKHLLVCLKKLQ